MSKIVLKYMFPETYSYREFLSQQHLVFHMVMSCGWRRVKGVTWDGGRLRMGESFYAWQPEAWPWPGAKRAKRAWFFSGTHTHIYIYYHVISCIHICMCFVFFFMYWFSYVWFLFCFSFLIYLFTHLIVWLMCIKNQGFSVLSGLCGSKTCTIPCGLSFLLSGGMSGTVCGVCTHPKVLHLTLDECVCCGVHHKCVVIINYSHLILI